MTRRLLVFGRRGPAFTYAGPPVHVGNGAEVDTAVGRARASARRGFVDAGTTKIRTNAWASKGWLEVAEDPDV